MRPYEIVVIFDAGLEESDVRAVLDRATELIRSAGGSPGRVERWGKRRFAYELAHRWEGNYVLLGADAEPGGLDEVHRMLSLSDEVLRHKVVRLPDSPRARRTVGQSRRGDRETATQGELTSERS